jgi:hypothetical protein
MKASKHPIRKGSSIPETPWNRLCRATGVAPGEGMESDTQCASLGEKP